MPRVAPVVHEAFHGRHLPAQHGLDSRPVVEQRIALSLGGSAAPSRIAQPKAPVAPTDLRGEQRNGLVGVRGHLLQHDHVCKRPPDDCGEVPDLLGRVRVGATSQVAHVKGAQSESSFVLGSRRPLLSQSFVQGDVGSVTRHGVRVCCRCLLLLAAAAMFAVVGQDSPVRRVGFELGVLLHRLHRAHLPPCVRGAHPLNVNDRAVLHNPHMVASVAPCRLHVASTSGVLA
mmetsp:Transcript_37563/g.86719  ORF Transcript_37563/g.86719 Transcript_37563/m.86719 type:complete len:230 (-) Transcript_37563:158-847(-)